MSEIAVEIGAMSGPSKRLAMTPPPMGLYVHVPWCVKKCPYCDFNSHVAREPVDQQGFIRALIADLRREVAGGAIAPVDSIFIGGGTPSLLAGAAISELLDGVARLLPLTDACEITLEANPGTVDAANFHDYRLAGVNRLSIGVQSLDPARLQALGRIHTPDDALGALQLARRAGFDNVNLDLMFGLPGQSLDGVLADLRQAVDLAPEHLSWYQLTLEPNTAFYRTPPPLPDDERVADMSDAGLALLEAAGYARYEISAFARPDRRCRHNLNYWQFGDYLGIGPGAHGKRSYPSGAIVRRSKRRGPTDYLASAATGSVSREWSLDADDRVIEFFLNALRLPDGVPAEWFVARTGLALERVENPITQAVELDLLVDDTARIRPTGRGLRYLNDLLGLFAPA